MKSILANKAINENLEFSEDEYQSLMAAVRPVFELISNGLFSDAIKSIKLRKECLSDLPDILEKLYTANCELRKVKSTCEPSVPGNLEKSTRIIDFKRTDHRRNISDATLNRSVNSSYFSVYSDAFETLQLNRYNSTLQNVFYFKEYSYPTYFNTFVRNLFETLNSSFKTRLAVFEPFGSRINMKRYDESFLIDLGNCDNSSFETASRLALFHPGQNILDRLCNNREKYEVLIIYDKSCIEKDMIAGLKVHKYNLVKSRNDINFFKLEAEECISNDIEGTALNISEIENFKDISNKSIKRKLYRRHFIDSFLDKYKTYSQEA